MSHPLDPLRSRIRELVERYAPLKASEAHAILRSEGWTRGQIDYARRQVVTVRGTTKAASWHTVTPPRPKRPKQTPAERAARRRERRARLRAERSGRVAPPTTVRPPRTCEVCDLPIGRRAPGEAPRCLRHRAVVA